VDEDFCPLTGRWSDIVEEEERATAAAATVSAALATLPLPVETINVTVSAPSTPIKVATTPVEPPPAAPTSIASLLLRQTSLMTDATVGASGASTVVTRTVTSSSAASPVPDTCRSLEDGDITYAVRLAPLPDVNTVTDALFSSYRTTLTRDQLQRIVRLLFDLLRDTSVFLMERIFVARLMGQPSDEILDEILRLLRRFTAGERRQ